MDFSFLIVRVVILCVSSPVFFNIAYRGVDEQVAIVIIPVTVIRLFFCDLCLAKLCYVAISGVSQQHGVPEDIDAL